MVPDELDTSIGNGLEGYCRLRLVSPATIAWSFDRHPDGEQVERVTPTAEAWQAFAAALGTAGIFDWMSEYADSSVVDGTYWSVTYRLASQRVESSGVNAYPTGFSDVCIAIERLAGGRTFR